MRCRHNCWHNIKYSHTGIMKNGVKEVAMKQTRLVEFQRPEFEALRRQDREVIYQAVRAKFGPDHSISMSELEYEYERKHDN